MTGDDARALAEESGIDPATVEAYLRRGAVALAADPGADLDEVVRRFGEESRAFTGRFPDPVSRYTGYRQAVRDAVVHEAYTLIRQAAGGENPRRAAYRIGGRRAAR